MSKKESSTNKNNELTDFLENDIQRLKLMDQVLSQKIESMQTYQKVDLLIERQEEQCHKAREKVIKNIIKNKTSVNEKLDLIWEESFKGLIK